MDASPRLLGSGGSRLACRRSLRSLLPLAQTEASLRSAARLASLAVHFEALPLVAPRYCSLRASLTSFAPVLVPLDSRRSSSDVRLASLGSPSPSVPEKPAPCGVPPDIVLRGVERGPPPGESSCLTNGIII